VGELFANFFVAVGPTIANNLDLIGVYVVLALGLNMINGMAGMFSLGHAGFWAIGAYASAAMTVYNPLGLPWFAAYGLGIVLAVVLAAIAGFVIAVPCLRLTGDYLAIATLGFGIIIVTILYNLEIVGAARGFTGIPTYASTWFIWLMVAVTLVFYYRIQFSNIGRLIQALREDEIAAQAIGVNRVAWKTLVFVLGAGVAGLAGALYANSATYLNPSGFEFEQSVKILTMVVLGGLGSITGVTIAAIALTVLPELLRLLNLHDYQMLIFASALLVMVLTRPQGLLGQRELWHAPFLRKLWDPDGFGRKAAETAATPPGQPAMKAAKTKGANG
jgi:branched-chain amino acid transport system permease protein